MKKDVMRMTTAQFAKLHEVNKRTLHYYDSIGLFSPKSKGENGYRYYENQQSMDFEYIRMLKELNMSIEEIKAYVQNPNPKDFLRIAEQKSREIEEEIKRLEKTRQVLFQKKQQIERCESLHGVEIHFTECEEERYYVTPFPFTEEDWQSLFLYVKDIWGIEQCRMGIGSYLSAEKAASGEFKQYDGLFTPVWNEIEEPEVLIKPAGRYLCGYHKGTWDELPGLYEKMFQFAADAGAELLGYAYEIGMNDFVIAREEEYVTQIMIQVKDERGCLSAP